MLSKQTKRIKRHKRVRAKIQGTSNVPRFCVFRSNKYIYGQLIDDEKGKTIIQLNDKDLKLKVKGKIAKAKTLGKAIAEKAKEKKVGKVVFDRAGYKYHGRVKAVADGAREGGLSF